MKQDSSEKDGQKPDEKNDTPKDVEENSSTTSPARKDKKAVS